MKKYILVTLSILILMMSLSGCSTNEAKEKYSIQLCGFSDSIPEAVNKLEYNAWVKTDFFDESAEPNIEMKIGNFSFKGDYESSCRRGYDYYDTHTYFAEDYSSVYIAEDGQLCGFSYGPDVLNHLAEFEETDEIYTEAECRDIAYTFFRNTLGLDTADYTISMKHDENGRRYTFLFIKYVDGFSSADEVRIRVAEKNGLLYGFSALMLDRMPLDAQVNFDLEEIERQITKRLDEKYAEAKEIYDKVEYDFNTDKYTLTMDENGAYMLVCSVTIHCITVHESGGTAHRGELLRFVVREN